MTIRFAEAADIVGILEIINYEIEHSTSIYDYEARTMEEQTKWFEEKLSAELPVIVVEEDGKIMGFASYGNFRTKIAYRFTAEHTIYMHPEARGKGYGKKLMRQLIVTAQAKGIHTLIAGIDADNTDSIIFHKKFGFKEVAKMYEVAYKFDRWLNLVFMQLILE